jgi:hypothetical protein
MGVLFESILLFSLAVLIILVGLLVYYFKKRIVEIEQKNTKCLEIVQDVYMQQLQMKKEIYSVLFKEQPSHQHQDERIHVVLSEDDSEEEDEEDSEDSDEDSDDEDSDDEDSDDEEQKVKIVNVNLDYPKECDIDIDNESESEDEIIDEPEAGIVSLDEAETIVVNKVDSPKNAVSKDELQKMSPATLKSLLISKGQNAESVGKMKKKELVDMLFAL